MAIPEKRSATESDIPATPNDVVSYPRKRVALACEVCRSRKTRCNAEKPACSFCKKLGIECVYKGPSTNDKVRHEDVGTSTARLDRIESTLESITAILDIQYGARPKPTTPMSHHSDNLTTSPVSVPSSTTRRPLPRMPNLFSFNGPDPWRYDCTKNFFSDQLVSLTDMYNVQQTPELDLSRPHLWRLQQSFAENVLKWLPIFDHETVSQHLQAAQSSRYEHNSPSLCLVSLIRAIGSLAMDSRLYWPSLHQLPGFAYYLQAHEAMEKFAYFSTEICILQCRTLAAIYFLYAMRPLEAWRAVCQASQNCILVLKAGILQQRDAQYREAFERIYWICYILDSELEICLELPSSGLRAYEADVPLPTSAYEEEGMYYLLALSSLRKLMVEVVNAVWTKGSAVATYAPVVVMELRNQIDDWYLHLPSSLRFPSDHSLLFDKRRAFLRCQYHALIAVVFWPFVPRSKDASYVVHRPNDEESDRVTRGAEDCLKACRDLLRVADEILTQKTLDSHVMVRIYFSLATVLLLTFSGADSESPETLGDQALLENALENLSHWKVVPFMQQPLAEFERMSQLKGLRISGL